jgi:acetylornithine deacetylase
VDELRERLVAAVDARHDDLETLLAALVRERTLLGDEEGAQRIVEERLRDLGFEVERVAPDAEAALADPRAGIPLRSYDGRSCAAGRLRGTGGGRSLHLSGHVDVVPVEAPERWSHDPWGAEVADGRMYGRGAGDMKAGLAAYLIAAEAVLEVCGPLAGDLVFSSVIEEECGGNGMWAVVRAGFTADGTLIGEPSGLALHHGASGVIWARVRAVAPPAHASLVRPEDAPVDAIVRAIGELRRLERDLNEAETDPGLGSDHPYSLNLGEIHGGAWTSSLPAAVDLRVRVGFGLDRSPAEAQELVRAAVARAGDGLEVTFDGFRAHAYRHELSSDFARLVASCHRELHGRDPEALVSAGTTDARFVDGPALCYGPRSGNAHGTDEWVDLASVRDTARLAALTAAAWTA